jgi:phosphate transport system permease protein
MSWHLVTEMPTSTVRRLDTSGYHNGLLGSIYLVATAALFAVPVGIGAAIYLEEYAPQNWLTKILQTNISNLAGVPSVVYGLLGLGVLVNFLGMGTFLGRSLLAGGITMGLLVMPLVIIASQEAIRAVPLSLRQGAFALGGTPWQVARSHVLPAALPGILTGVILAVARAFGETAPLIVAGASLYTSFVPNAPLDTYTVLPIQIFDYTTRAQAEFKNFAASGIVMLMTIVLLVNLAAIIIRERVGRRTRW